METRSNVAYPSTASAAESACSPLDRSVTHRHIRSVAEAASVDWVAGLRDRSPTGKALLADLSDRLRRSLARSFARKFSDADLDDLTQTSLLRITEKLDSFEGRSKFTTWATAIAVHEALAELRRRKYQHLDLETAVDEGKASLEPVGPAALLRSQADVLLRNAIDEVLSPRQRTALLAELGGLPLMEVARRMQSSRGALYKLLHDARKRLRAHFAERGVTADDVLLGPESEG